MPGFINLDFADVRTVMADMGRAMMGTGEASGRIGPCVGRRHRQPLLDESLEGASGLLISIIGGEDMRLMEVDEAARRIKALADPEAEIIWGSAFDPRLEGRIRVSIVATGLDRAARAVAEQDLVEPMPAAFPKPAAIEPALARALSAPELYPVPTQTRASESPLPSAMSIDEMLAPVEAPDVQHEVEMDLPKVELKGERVVATEQAPEAPAEDHMRARERVRGPSLFERMAMAARGAVIRHASTSTASTASQSTFLMSSHAPIHPLCHKYRGRWNSSGLADTSILFAPAVPCS
jgi:cell division protein FtsZ